MSDSVRPQRRQPTRLPRPWDFPGKNTGVGCHFLLQCMKVKSEVKSLSRVRLLATPWTAAYQAPPSMGFSRQEYWSGVPLPSPILYLYLLSIFNTAAKVTLSSSKSHLTLCDPMDSSPPGSSVQGFPRQEYWSELPFPSPGIFTTQIKPSSPAQQVGSLPLSHLRRLQRNITQPQTGTNLS